VRWRRSGIVVVLLALTACAPVSPAASPARTTAAASASPPSSSPSPRPAAAPSTAAPAASPAAAAASPAAAAQGSVVVLDPGHNGGNAAHPEIVDAPVPDGRGGTKPCNTTGTATDAGYPEHAFTWDVALRTRARLEAAGVRVVLTRQDDTGVGPCVDVRGRMAAQVGAVAFVGIHGDGAAPGGRGFHVITSSPPPAGPAVAADSAALAVAIRDALTAVEPVSTYLGQDGLDPRPDLAGLNLNAAPAVYLECGNMRNPTDAAWMSSPAGRDAIAARLAAGVLAFLGH
jgi:N-acetylmuramoyl-L-alanine amidase